MHIRNTVAIVTGASSGIGEATARLLSQKGAKVVLAARSQEKLEHLAQELPNSLAFPADMTIDTDVAALVAAAHKRFGRIDLLINNAGQGYDATVEQIDIPTFRQIFALDMLGPIQAMQQVIPIMRKQQEGMIINISSGTALMTLPGMSPYASLKRALAAMTLAAREELKPDHIVVSVLYPYITKTNFEKNTIGGSGELPEQGDLPPFDTPEFVAEKIVETIHSEAAAVYAHDWMKQ